MRRKGRPPAWTSDEREQVLVLADEGMPQRSIAEQVFGDARYRGRVERILRERVLAPRPLELDIDGASPEADGAAAYVALDVAGVRQLLMRFERALLESSEVPSLADLDRLLRLKRQLDAMETVARLRALTRERQ